LGHVNGGPAANIIYFSEGKISYIHATKGLFRRFLIKAGAAFEQRIYDCENKWEKPTKFGKGLSFVDVA
jgi:hypothetical protein